jgi:hypothetical protein
MMSMRPCRPELKMLRCRGLLAILDPSHVLRGIGRCAAAVLLLGIAWPGTAGALIAACRDGSVVFAKRWEDVHCAGAVEVAPGEVPPLGPRPRNPIRERQAFRKKLEATREWGIEAQLEALPAEPVQIHLAHSRAVEARLRAELAARGSTVRGPILLFWAEPTTAELSATSPSFAQGGVTFRPQRGDPSQLGWISSSDVAVGSGVPELGYVVLPAGFDPTRPLVVFWGDGVSAAWLRR